MHSYFLPRGNCHSNPKSNNMFSSEHVTPSLACGYRDGYEYKFMHIDGQNATLVQGWYQRILEHLLGKNAFVILAK